MNNEKIKGETQSVDGSGSSVCYLSAVVARGETLNWRRQYHDESGGVITAVESYHGGWYVLDDLSGGCWVAYFEPDDGSDSENRTRIEVHRGSAMRCMAACEMYEPDR